MLEYDVNERMINMTKNAISHINSKLENMSDGEKKMYYVQKGRDLNVIGSIKFANGKDSKTFIHDVLNDINEDIKDF